MIRSGGVRPDLDRPDGRAASLEAAIICGRQNMKSWGMQLIALGRLLQPGGDKLAVWSAHEVGTSQATFRDFQELFDLHPWLAKRVTKVSQANGKEGIEFTGGRWLRFRARIRTGGRGLSGDALFLDEAFALEPAHMGALLPILSTRRRAAVFYGSSAGMEKSATLRQIRDRGRAGGLAYVEFCAPGSLRDPGCVDDKCLHEAGTAGCTLDREDLWMLANPAIRVGRITLDYMREERKALPPAEFARERLGWWDEANALALGLPLDVWDACTDPQSQPDGPVSFAVEVSLDRAWATVGAAGVRADGRPHVEVVERRRGTDWTLDRVTELWQRWGRPVTVDPSSPAGSLVQGLRERGVEVVTPAAAEIAAGCARLFDGVSEGRWRHRGQRELSEAVLVATRRNVGDGAWRWDRRSSGDDVSALYAVTLASLGIGATAAPSIW